MTHRARTIGPAPDGAFGPSRGYAFRLLPGLAMPVILGVLTGSSIGARVLAVAKVKTIRRAFVVVIVALGVEMIFTGATGRL